MYQQLPLIVPDCPWKPPEFSALPSWKGARRVAIDVETRDEHLLELGPGVRRGGYIVGIAFAIEGGPKHYLPFRHENGGNMPAEQCLAYIRDQAKEFEGDIVGTNFGYDLDYLLEEKIEFPRVRFFRDVQIAEPLLDELARSYSLDTLAKKYLGRTKETQLLAEAAAAYGMQTKKGKKPEIGQWIWRVPGHYAGFYGEADVDLPLQILNKQERRIDEEELWGVYNLESRLLPVLVRMRRRGVRIDFDHLRHVEKWSIAQEAEALRKVKDATGVHIKIDERTGDSDSMNSEMCAQALRAAGIQVYNNSRGASVDKELLAEHRDNPVAAALERARKVNKIRTTFCASIRRYAVNGRIHCTFNQLRKEKDDGDLGGAAFGRLSSENPNLQQQPARDPELGPFWRKVYIPDEGCQWYANDYSQQEPKWVVHYAVITGAKLLGQEAWEAACRAAQMYIDDPSTDNHQMMADMIHGRKATKKERSDAKEIYLGLSYGMGGAKLCRKLGLPTAWYVWDKENNCRVNTSTDRGKELLSMGYRSWEGAGPEGQALLDAFDAKVPFVKKLAKLCESRAEMVGFIRTVSGRKCRFPEDVVNGGYDWVHKALNRLIQGSSADQTKTAMVEIDAAGLPIQLQVHDEIDGSCRDRAEAEAVAEIMRNCIPMKIPMKVDVEIGSSWGDSM